MEVKASAKYLRASPRKLRELTRGWQGRPAEAVLTQLTAYPQKGSEFLLKAVKQALANAKNNFKVEGDLLVKRIEIGQGPAFKRMDKSHGARFDRGIIRKKTSHIFLTLEERKKPEKEVKEVKEVKKEVKKIKARSKSGKES